MQAALTALPDEQALTDLASHVHGLGGGEATDAPLEPRRGRRGRCCEHAEHGADHRPHHGSP
jgi:hypothetical protein